MKALDIVILAAGKGSRMHSSKPKVLHPLAGKPLLAHVLATARALSPASISVVIGYGAEQVKAAFSDADDVHWVQQHQQLGTGHAVLQVLPTLKPDNQTLVLYGDVPLITAAILQPLFALEAPLKLLSAKLEEPSGYGRIVRKNNKIAAIVEEKDANEQEKQITEINTGILVANNKLLLPNLHKLAAANNQQEYYLTDIIALAVKAGQPVQALCADNPETVLGVNTRHQLAQIERIYQQNIAGVLLDNGVTLTDPARLDVRGKLTCGRDVVIEPNVIFSGDVCLGDGVVVEANCIISNSQIGANSVVHSHSIIDNATLESDVTVGPFARIRPETWLQKSSKVGNFVETKNTVVGENSKINHLSYVGDAQVGSRVNIGAGTITCNYDGTSKHQTIIKDDAFIGSNASLVAPLTIGNNSTVAAGSTITKNTGDNSLAITRAKQTQIKGWKRAEKK